MKVAFTVNGEAVELLCEPQASLLEALRDGLGLTGTKEGCSDGNCGACSVLMDGRLVNSCLVLAAEVEGREVTTVEGLASWPALHPLQQAFVDEDALQCGFCTPGILVAAKALLDRNPDPSEEEIRSWLAGNLCRCTGYEPIVKAVRAAAKAVSRARRPAAPAPGFRVVGTSPTRVDAADKVTGRAIFGADVRLPGTAVGRILRSPHAHARIRAIDASRARALPGVLAVVTAKDLPPVGDAGWERDNILAGDKVLYQGHAVAAAAATTAAIAERALALIKVDYEVLEPVLDVVAAAAPDAPLLHEKLVTRTVAAAATGQPQRPSNVALHLLHVKGDPKAGFAQAEVVIEREFRTLMVHQGYIEPQAATAVWGPDGALTVHAATQGAFSLRAQLAEQLDLPMSRVRVIPTEIGGAFGGKERSAIEVPAALLSRRCGRPVKIVMSRSEVLTGTGPSPGAAIRVKVGARRTGEIVAAEADLAYEAGAYPGSMVDAAARNIFAAYDIPNVRVEARDVVVNKPQAAPYRAPCTTAAAFAGEQVIDELARALGLDPIEMRLRNSAKEGTRLADGFVHANIGAREVLEAARGSAHYRSQLSGANRGRGVAHGYWGNWGAQSSCVMSVNADGTVALATGNVDVTGTRTSLAMQAAEALGLAPDRIRPRVGDTDSTGYADVSAGSRTTVACGLAVIKAAGDLLSQLKTRAAILLETTGDQVEYRQGLFTSRDGKAKVTFEQVAAQTGRTGGPVTAAASVNMRQWGTAFATHIVDVEVDPETGKVRLLRYTAVQDVGRSIHPVAVEGQMRGGAAQGIGWALYEGCLYDRRGRLLNPSLLDNRLPTALDVPPIETIIVEVPSRHHPYGSRGVGEAPIVPPPAAIANAVAAATGRRVTRLPMTAARVLEATGVLKG